MLAQTFLSAVTTYEIITSYLFLGLLHYRQSGVQKTVQGDRLS
jgi:hypothetical protein